MIEDKPWARARNTDPETSKVSGRTANAETHRAQIYALMAARPHHDWDQHEVAQETGIADPWKRISELREANLIHVTGTRRGAKGKPVQTYRTIRPRPKHRYRFKIGEIHE